jgi:hypothetical protein
MARNNCNDPRGAVAWQHREEWEHMPKKVKWGVSGKDVDQVEDDSFEPYDGPTPPRGVYVGKIKTIKKAESSNGNDMIKLLIIIDGKASGKPKYDGAPIFDNVPVTEQTMFRVKQLMLGLGGTGKNFDATVIDEDDNITKFGTIRPKDMLIRFATKTELYGEETNAKVSRYMPPKEDEPDDEDDSDYDEEDDSEEYDEDTDEDEDEDEDDEEVDDEDDEDDDEEYEDEEEEEEKPAPRRAAKKSAPAKKAAPAKKTAKPTPSKAAKKAAPTKAAAKRRRPTDDEEPPF